MEVSTLYLKKYVHDKSPEIYEFMIPLKIFVFIDCQLNYFEEKKHKLFINYKLKNLFLLI